MRNVIILAAALIGALPLAARSASLNHKIADVMTCTSQYVRQITGANADFSNTIGGNGISMPLELEANVGACLSATGYKYSPNSPAWPIDNAMYAEELSTFVTQMVSHIQ